MFPFFNVESSYWDNDLEYAQWEAFEAELRKLNKLAMSDEEEDSENDTDVEYIPGSSSKNFAVCKKFSLLRKLTLLISEDKKSEDERACPVVEGRRAAAAGIATAAMLPVALLVDIVLVAVVMRRSNQEGMSAKVNTNSTSTAVHLDLCQPLPNEQLRIRHPPTLIPLLSQPLTLMWAPPMPRSTPPFWANDLDNDF